MGATFCDLEFLWISGSHTKTMKICGEIYILPSLSAATSWPCSASRASQLNWGEIIVQVSLSPKPYGRYSKFPTPHRKSMQNDDDLIFLIRNQRNTRILMCYHGVSSPITSVYKKCHSWWCLRDTWPQQPEGMQHCWKRQRHCFLPQWCFIRIWFTFQQHG